MLYTTKNNITFIFTYLTDFEQFFYYYISGIKITINMYYFFGFQMI